MKKSFSSKIMKGFAVLFTVLLVTAGCGSGNSGKTDGSKDTATSTSAKEESGTRKFTDSAGREVEVPKTITKIAPSGGLAQMVLYTAAPDMLVGFANPISDSAKEFINEKYWDLPTFGQFYGKNSSLNMEALTEAAPDVIIDIGEAKKTVKEDMDKIQDQVDIPTVFIEAKLEGMSDAYKKLGELLGNTDETDKLADYCKKVIDTANKNAKSISDADKKSVYYAAGDAGLNTNAEGSFHAEIFDVIGVKNAATGVDFASQGSGTVVSMEQIMQWQPDYIIADSENVYNLIKTDATWQELTAVKEGRVYRVPNSPYNFIGLPPSVNRIIGIQWVGNLVYPKVYDLDIKKTVKEFYSLFYHVDVTDAQLDKLLENSLAK